jgi:predicted TIM-barrel fold metal-dependent hydrolase
MGVGAQANPWLACAQAEPVSVIDTHIHLFDPTRPGGVPWPEKSDTVLYKPSLPERYVGQSAPFGVVGAIAIECSQLESDNQWLLNVVARNPVMVGAVGDLVPGAANYSADLEKLHANPLFLGIRYGNLWNRDLAADMEKPGFVDGLKALAAAGLVLESANPDPRLIGALLKVAELVPELRIVIDHLPNARVPSEEASRKDYFADLRALAQSTKIFVKLSEIPVRENGQLVTDANFYRERVDALWEIFGEDHVMFGSDWPNSDAVSSYAQTFGIVRAYIAQKRPEARQKYFWKNSISAYRWKPRQRDQRLA